MSLNDVSKGDSLRIAKPIAHFTDVQPNDLRMAHGTTQFTYSVDGDNYSIGVRMKNGRLEVINSSGERIANLGFRDSDGDGIVDVAKPGDSV